MKNKGMRLALIFAVAIACLSGCGEEEPKNKQEGTHSVSPTEVEEEKVKETTYRMTKDYVKTLGRTYLMDDVLWLSYSASGVEFRFQGTECVVNLRGDQMFAKDGHRARVAAFVNGERVLDEMVDFIDETFTILKSDTEQDVVIRIVKLSEVSDSTVGISSIVAKGTLTPTEEKATKIEFVGDSITCGYGVDGTLQDTYSTTNEDATKAYAYLTAQLLDVDYSLVSQSGYGIVSGYTGTGEINSQQTLPQYYATYGHSYGAFESKQQTRKLAWDFAQFTPDAVVINLGTNDNSYCKNDEEKKEAYIVGYVAFLKQIREKNPNAKLVCALGIMGAELYPSIEKAVERYTQETGDTNITTYRFAVQNQAEDGIAVDWHPSAATHRKSAERFAEFLKEELSLR